MSGDSPYDREIVVADLSSEWIQRTRSEQSGSNAVLEAYAFNGRSRWDEVSGGQGQRANNGVVADTGRRPTWYEQNMPNNPLPPKQERGLPADGGRAGGQSPQTTSPPRDLGPAPQPPGGGPIIGRDPDWAKNPVKELPYPQGQPRHPLDAPPVVDPRPAEDQLASNLTLIALLGGCLGLMRNPIGRGIAGPAGLAVLGKLIWDNRPR